MHWFLKVITVIHFVVNTNCLPVGNHSQYLLTNNRRYPDSFYEPERNARAHSNYPKALAFREKSGVKRDLDVGIEVNAPPTKKFESSLDKLKNMLETALAEQLQQPDCPNCEEEIPVQRTVKPAYRCDEWNSKQRICILERNVGDSVTFYLSTGSNGNSRHPNVTWKKEYHMGNSADRTEFVIKSENPPENIIIGKKGYELRISPITETDVEYNMFSATLTTSSSKLNKVNFMIRIVPIDLGFVYVGEIIELNLRNYVSLPANSMTFKWYMEKDGEHGTLPSNMRVSFAGSSIKISELRQEQEGILACAVYTNLQFLATKKRFLIKDLERNKDVLQSSPNHSLVFKELLSLRDKRDPNKHEVPNSVIKLSRHRLERSLPEEIEDQLYNTESPNNFFTPNIIPSRSHNYNLEIGGSHEHEEEPQIPEDYQNKFPEISESEDDEENSLKAKQNNILIDNELEDKKPVEVKSVIPQSIIENLPPQNEATLDDMNLPTREYQPEDILINKYNNQKATTYNIQEEKKKKFQHHMNALGKKSDQTKIQYLDDIQAKKATPNKKNDFSEIVLNIDKVMRPHQVTVEDRISKLISSCSNDFECSESALCVRYSLKDSGFCKCLPGFHGVGIFCREEIWLSNSKFDVEEIHNPNYM